MPLASMTGFARASAEALGRVATWEARSVNGRGLEVRLRLPPGYDRLESEIRTRAAKRFDRDLTTRISHLTTLVQPAIILLVALFVGIVAYSMIAGILTSVSSLKSR